MTIQSHTRYPVQTPFAAGREGGLHLWIHHDVKRTPALELQDLVHDHKHANGLADHIHTDQPGAEARA